MPALTRPSPTALPAAARVFESVLTGLAVFIAAGCTERDSDLIVAVVREPTSPPSELLVLPRNVQAVIDERPTGGASLTSGTTGGGTYTDSQANKTLFRVSSLEDLKLRASGDAPAVVVLDAGTYTGSGDARSVQACLRACEADDPNAERTAPAAQCTNGESLFDVDLRSDVVRVGSNKTVIGLDEGARLVDVSVSLDGSSNVILRNIAIENLDTDVSTRSDGISLAPAHHVWIDHVTLSNISHTALPIVSTWDQDQDQAVVDESGYVTITNSDFDGFLGSACSQRSELVLTTNRNPAITIARSWFRRARIRVPNLFGPGTWAHLYNNLWSDIDGRGLAVSCGAVAIAQGNVLEAAHNGLYNSDSGLPDWQFCAVGYFGALYAPTDAADAETNLLDSASTQDLGDAAPPDSATTTPRRLDGSEYELTVPVESGTRTETYRVTLASDPALLADDIPMTAGVGRLF